MARDFAAPPGSSGPGSSGPGSSGTSRFPTTLWYSRSSVPTALGIAAQLGWLQQEFSPESIAVRSLQQSGDPLLRESHVDHHLPDSFRQGGSVPALWAYSAGADTRLIGLTWTEEFQAVLSLRGSGIDSAQQLRGRRLGLPSRPNERIDMARATALRGYLTLLDVEGIGYDEVQLVDVETAPLSANHLPIDNRNSAAWASTPAGHLTRRDYRADVLALLRGDVDAIYVKGVRGIEVARLLGEQVQVAADIGGHPDIHVRSNNSTPRPLTISASTLENYPDVAVRFLRRVVEAGAWAETHPRETVALLGRETGSVEEWISYAYGVEVHRYLRTDLADYALSALDDFKNFLFKWGFLPHNFNLNGWVDFEPLEQVHRLPRKRIA